MFPLMTFLFELKRMCLNLHKNLNLEEYKMDNNRWLCNIVVSTFLPSINRIHYRDVLTDDLFLRRLSLVVLHAQTVVTGGKRGGISVRHRTLVPKDVSEK